MNTDSIKIFTRNTLIKLSKIKKIKLNESFMKNNKIDSLDLLNLYSLLEKKYKIKFKSSELAKLNSIDQICVIINKKTNEKKYSKK